MSTKTFNNLFFFLPAFTINMVMKSNRQQTFKTMVLMWQLDLVKDLQGLNITTITIINMN